MVVGMAAATVVGITVVGITAAGMVVAIMVEATALATRISAAGIMAGQGSELTPGMVVQISARSVVQPCAPQTSATR